METTLLFRVYGLELIQKAPTPRNTKYSHCGLGFRYNTLGTLSIRGVVFLEYWGKGLVGNQMGHDMGTGIMQGYIGSVCKCLQKLEQGVTSLLAISAQLSILRLRSDSEFHGSRE